MLSDAGNEAYREEPTPSVDARCFSQRCKERTENVYRMVGHCTNCRTSGIVILNRVGDEARNVDCPVCGVWKSVQQTRLAAPDEVPSL